MEEQTRRHKRCGRLIPVSQLRTHSEQCSGEPAGEVVQLFPGTAPPPPPAEEPVAELEADPITQATESLRTLGGLIFAAADTVESVAREVGDFADQTAGAIEVVSGSIDSVDQAATRVKDLGGRVIRMIRPEKPGDPQKPEGR
jgi:hypothetical protein